MADYCPECGTKIKKNNFYCSKCGAKVSGAEKGVQVKPDSKGTKSKKSGKGGRTALCIFLVLVMIIELAIVGLKYPGILLRGDNPRNVDPERYHGQDDTESWNVVNSEKVTMPKDGGEVTACGVTVCSTAENLSGDEEVEVIDYGTATDSDEEVHRYEVSMGEHRQFEVPVAVTIPVNLAEDEDVTVVHHIEETGEWVPLISEYDEETGTVTAYFSSFSEIETRKEKRNLHSKLYVINYGTNSNGEESSQTATLDISRYYWTILQQSDPKNLSDEAIKFVADPSLYAQDFDIYRDNYARDAGAAFDSASMANTVLGPIIDIASQIPAQYGSVKFDYSEPIGKSLGWVTLIMASAQAYKDFSDAGGDWNAVPAPAANAYKNLFAGSGTFYSFVSGYGSIGFSVAFIGVTLTSFALDYAIDEAKAQMSKRTADVFNAYFEKVAPFDKDAWYKTFKDAYYKSNNDPNKAMEVISDKINSTVEGFWTDIYNEENIDILIAATEADTKNIFTKDNIYFYNVSDEEKAALNAQMKQCLWKKYKKETMPLVNRFLMERLQDSMYAEISKVNEPFNNYMEFTIMETVPNIENDAESVAKYTGCTLAFGRDGKRVSDWDVITIPEGMEDGWQTNYSCTVLGNILAGCPDTILVYENESDCYSGKEPIYSRHFNADITGKQDTVIDLGSSEENEEPQEQALEVGDNWYEGVWCKSETGEGEGLRVTAGSGYIGIDTFRLAGVDDNSTVLKYKGSYMTDMTVGPNGDYIIIGQSEPDEEGHYSSAIKVFKPKDNPDVLEVIYAPAEVTGNKDTEGKSTWYRRDWGGNG